MRTKTLPVMLGLLMSICLFSATVSPVSAAENKGGEYKSLHGVKLVKGVFDFRIGEPKSALLHLDVVRQTIRDKALKTGKKKPTFTLVFSGPSVKLLSVNRMGFAADDAKTLDAIAGMLASLAKEGVRLEVCEIALGVFGIDPASVQPEVKKVGNGYVSLVGYGAQGYSLVPVY